MMAHRLRVLTGLKEFWFLVPMLWLPNIVTPVQEDLLPSAALCRYCMLMGYIHAYFFKIYIFLSCDVMCELENTEGTGVSQPWRDNCMSSLMWAKKNGQTHRGTDRVKIMVAKGWKCPKGKMLAQVSVFSYAWWVSFRDAMCSPGFISKQCCTLDRS